MKQNADRRPRLTGRYDMPETTGEPYNGIVNANRPRMADVLLDAKPTGKRPSKGKPRPTPKTPEPPTQNGSAASSYVRLRVLLREGQLTVEQVWMVKGVLTQPPELFGPFVWEVRLDDRRIAMGDIADMGEERGSFDPKDPKRGHRIVKTSEAEIPIRIAGNWTAKSLARAELFLSESKLRINRQRPADQPLHIQWPRELRLIAHLRGLAPKQMRPKPRPKQSQKTEGK